MDSVLDAANSFKTSSTHNWKTIYLYKPKPYFIILELFIMTELFVGKFGFNSHHKMFPVFSLARLYLLALTQ